MKKPFIKAFDISYQYEGEEGQGSPVLKNLCLEIEEGEFVAILGHNGSGKSTLAKLLNMILTPTTGKIWIDGKEVTDPNLSEEDLLAVRRQVGMVFKTPITKW